MSHRAVFSVTGERIDLRDASDEALAEALDGFEDEMRVLKEKRSIVTRELARRMGTQTRQRAGEWEIDLRPFASVRRV